MTEEKNLKYIQHYLEMINNKNPTMERIEVDNHTTELISKDPSQISEYSMISAIKQIPYGIIHNTNNIFQKNDPEGIF